MLDRIPGHNNNECSGDKSGSVMSNKNICGVLIGKEEGGRKGRELLQLV